VALVESEGRDVETNSEKRTVTPFLPDSSTGHGDQYDTFDMETETGPRNRFRTPQYIYIYIYVYRSGDASIPCRRRGLCK